MRTFAELHESLDLTSWSRPSFGRFYLPRSDYGPQTLVRHFDTDALVELVEPYVEFIGAVERWVAERPDVAELVEVQALTEVGQDFVARPFHAYYYALQAYDDPEEYDLVDVIPEQLAPMRERVAGHIAEGLTGRDQILQQVIADSLLGPSPTTVMGVDRWLIVSPCLSLEQLQRWAAS